LASSDKRGRGSIPLAPFNHQSHPGNEKNTTFGVAKNLCMNALLEEKWGRRILVPNDPQVVGALGASLLAKE
jgi:hypothetical protein